MLRTDEHHTQADYLREVCLHVVASLDDEELDSPDVDPDDKAAAVLIRQQLYYK